MEQAASLVERLNESELANNEMKRLKFIARLAALLFYYENGDYDLVLNQTDSVRRLYSRHLKKNVGGNLLLKLLVRLSSSSGRHEDIKLLNKFLQDLEALFKQYPEHQFLFTFAIIENWCKAKLNRDRTIFDYKKRIRQEHSKS